MVDVRSDGRERSVIGAAVRGLLAWSRILVPIPLLTAVLVISRSHSHATISLSRLVTAREAGSLARTA
jgi:hypothetical protein